MLKSLDMKRKFMHLCGSKFMIMPRKVTCSKCGKQFETGCLVRIPEICDDCLLIKKKKTKSKFSVEEWLDFINEKIEG
jgi:hypothetical protein